MRSTPLARILCLASVLLASSAIAQTTSPGAPQTPPPVPAEQPAASQPAAGTQPPAASPQPPAPTPVPAPEQTPAPAATPASAAAPVSTVPHAVDPVKARYNVQVMESVLERAVRFAAGQMNRRLQAVSPDLLQLSGAARARGFRLPGYGVFFDVDVPAALRHTMGWTLRLMQQSDQNAQRALAAIRQAFADLDPKQRGQAEGALKLLETRFRPAPRPRAIEPQQEQPSGEATATAVSTGTPLPSASAPAESTPAPTAEPNADDLAWAQNPDLTYEMEVRDAIMSAMLEYGSTLALGPDEYLTIAARDSENVVMPGDLSETVTVLLRIKFSDLYEYKAGRLSEADARKRIEVREF